MKTLDSIREEVAQREGYDTWDDLFMDAMTGSITSNVFDVVITDIATMYAEEALEEACDRATILETTAYSESKKIDCKSHKQIVNSTQGIVKTLRVDKGAFLSVKNQLK